MASEVYSQLEMAPPLSRRHVYSCSESHLDGESSWKALSLEVVNDGQMEDITS